MCIRDSRGRTPRTMCRPWARGPEPESAVGTAPPLKIRESYCDTPSRHGCCQPWHPNFCHPHAVVVGAGAGPWCIARKESGCLPVVAAAPNGRRRWLECSAPGSRLGSGRILAPTFIIGALSVVINQPAQQPPRPRALPVRRRPRTSRTTSLLGAASTTIRPSLLGTKCLARTGPRPHNVS